MKAVVGNTVIAESDKDDLIQIEGNWYFPPSSVKTELLTERALAHPVEHLLVEPGPLAGHVCRHRGQHQQ